MWRYNHASPLSICFFQRVQVQLVFLMFLSPVCLCVPTKHTPNCYSILFTVLNIRFICQYSKSASDTNRKLVYVDPVYNEDIYICTYLYLCICIYDMNTPLLRSYWDKHPTFAYLKKTTGVTGVSPGLPIVDVAASASYVNFTDQVKQNEGGKWWQYCVAEPWVKKLKRLVTKYMYCRYYLFEVFFSHHPVFWLIFSWWCSKGGQKQTLQHVACWKSILSNRKTCSN